MKKKISEAQTESEEEAQTKSEEDFKTPEDWIPVPVKTGWRPLRKDPKTHQIVPEAGRRWTITVNLGSMPPSLQEDVKSEDSKRWERCDQWLKTMLPRQRWIASLEEGKEGNRHLQLFIANATPVRQKFIVEHLGHPHYEATRSSVAANVAYASKPSSPEKGLHLAGPWTNGDWNEILATPPAKGKLDQLREWVFDLDRPCTRLLLHQDPDLGVLSLQQKAFVDQLFEDRMTLLQERRAEAGDPDRTCIWVWGPTRTGKSFDVNMLRRRGLLGSVYRATSLEHPFDRYEGEHAIWLEEFRGGVPLSVMLSVTDRYSDVAADARYHLKPLVHEIVIVTTNVSPDQIYPDADPASRAAFLARWTVFEKRSKTDHPILRRFGIPREEWPDAAEIPDDPIIPDMMPADLQAELDERWSQEDSYDDEEDYF